MNFTSAPLPNPHKDLVYVMSSKGSSPQFDIICPIWSAERILLIYQNLSTQTNRQKAVEQTKEPLHREGFFEFLYISTTSIYHIYYYNTACRTLNFQIFLRIHLLSPSPHLPYNDPQKYERNSSADSQLCGGSRLALTKKVRRCSGQQHKQCQHSKSKQPCDNPNGAAQLPGRAKAVFWKFGQIHDRFRKFRQKM